MNDSFLNTTGRARQPVVMIVDDEEMVTRSLASFLQWETEYRVLTALSPVEALRT
ncbi:MAG: hypothetical protein HY710_00325, partial [Candidatus Latescibacteria bacterium]|nr:hypothetical protein [Candidatus Latescibacterota bacterium]